MPSEVLLLLLRPHAAIARRCLHHG
jgi:hypothetical protein